MSYEELNEMAGERECPLAGVNEDGENVIVERGSNDGGNYVRVETFQKNGWTRINVYWEDGTVEEMYER